MPLFGYKVGFVPADHDLPTDACVTYLDESSAPGSESFITIYAHGETEAVAWAKVEAHVNKNQFSDLQDQMILH